MSVEELLQRHGVKPTANRILVARALGESARPLSMGELEERLETLDKSSVFRVLGVFREAHLVHFLDGDPVRYELCHSQGEQHDDDLHVHFYCVKCRRTFCLDDTPIPPVEIPAGYRVDEASYMLRGCCPECAG